MLSSGALVPALLEFPFKIGDLPEKGQVTLSDRCEFRDSVLGRSLGGSLDPVRSCKQTKSKRGQRILPLKCLPHLTASEDSPSSSLPLPGVCLWEYSILGNNGREQREKEEKSLQAGNEEVPLSK